MVGKRSGKKQIGSAYSHPSANACFKGTAYKKAVNRMYLIQSVSVCPVYRFFLLHCDKEVAVHGWKQQSQSS